MSRQIRPGFSRPLARREEPAPPGLDGLVDLPPGKIAAVATYLELLTPPPQDRRPPPPRPDRRDAFTFAPIGADVPRYRALYAKVGEPWLWFSRAGMADGRLAAIIGDRDVEALALVVGGEDRGMIELDFRTRGECELAFLGLVPGATGQGLGTALLGEAIRRAFTRRIARLWLHTCTLDHPAAMRLYLRAGFRAYRRAIEIADDPRLTGAMPRNAAPWHPVL